jgi:carbamoyltransferase
VGASYDPSTALDLLSHLDVGRWVGGTRGDDVALRVVRPPDEDTLLAATVRAIQAGRVVGWYQGRFENGPRALGNRSILFDPGDVALARRVSTEVKARAPFRPYAISMAEETAMAAVDLPSPVPHTARWMQVVCPAREPGRLRAAVHVDGTTRPQVCSSADNPRYNSLLRAWSAESGVPALLNTSFNGRGYPIVDSPVEALAQFARSRMDVLVLGDTMLYKDRDG